MLAAAVTSAAGTNRRVGRPRPRGGPGKRGRLQFLATWPTCSQRRQRDGWVQREATWSVARQLKHFPTKSAGTGRRERRGRCVSPGTTLVDDCAESIRIHQGIPAHLGWGSSDRRRPTRVRRKTARSTHRRGGSTASFRQLAFSFRRRARRNPVKLLIFVLRIRRQTEANPLRGISFNMRRPSTRGWGEGWHIRIEEPTRIRGRSIVGATCARRGRGRGTTHLLLGADSRGVVHAVAERAAGVPVEVAAGAGWSPAGSVSLARERN